MKKNSSVIKIVFAALSIALVCIFTIIIQIPIPLGYMNLGNICILVIAYLFEPRIAFLAGGLGSCLADLLSGFPQWIIPTFIIKSLMGLVASFFIHKHSKEGKIFSISSFTGAILGALIMVAGYFIAGIFMYGSIITSAAQLPGLSIEGLFGMIGYLIFGLALEKGKVNHYLQRLMQK